jgi:glutaredoxin 3
MNKYKLYEAGCSVCKEAADELSGLIPGLEIIRLRAGDKDVQELEKLGVKSVPALVSSAGKILHINFGAPLDALK